MGKGTVLHDWGHLDWDRKTTQYITSIEKYSQKMCWGLHFLYQMLIEKKLAKGKYRTLMSKTCLEAINNSCCLREEVVHLDFGYTYTFVMVHKSVYRDLRGKVLQGYTDIAPTLPLHFCHRASVIGLFCYPQSKYMFKHFVTGRL